MALGQAGVAGNVGAQSQEIQDWNDWKSRVQNWQGVSDQELQRLDATGNQNADTVAKYILNRMFKENDAAKYLSPLYMSLMRQNALTPYIQQQVQMGSQGKSPLEGNYSQFLKDYVTSNQSGWGNIDTNAYKGMLQGLVNNLGQVRQNAREDSYGTFGDYWMNNPRLMATAMGLMQYGPGAKELRGRLDDAATGAWGDQVGGGIASSQWLKAMLDSINPYGLQY